jgi:cytochrome b561
MVLRLLWALINPKPMTLVNMPLWERWAERSVHFLLYFVVIAMPIAGWVGASAAGRPPHIGNLNLQLPIEQSKTLVDNAFAVHNTSAILIIVLFCIHFLAALYHHFIRKDDILRSMLPHSSHY